jgi:hypothetical protein
VNPIGMNVAQLGLMREDTNRIEKSFFLGFLTTEKWHPYKIKSTHLTQQPTSKKATGAKIVLLLV